MTDYIYLEHAHFCCVYPLFTSFWMISSVPENRFFSTFHLFPGYVFQSNSPRQRILQSQGTSRFVPAGHSHTRNLLSIPSPGSSNLRAARPLPTPPGARGDYIGEKTSTDGDPRRKPNSQSAATKSKPKLKRSLLGYLTYFRCI